MKLSDHEELSIFEMIGMMRGAVTQDKHHFYNMVTATQSDVGEEIKGFIGGTIPKVLDGARIPMNKQANNPSLSSPSVTAMKMFGALPIFKKAMDQIHAKKISVFPTPMHGSGQNAFDFMTNSLFQGEANLQSIVGKVLFGSNASDITPGHYLEESLQNLGKQIGQGIGADLQTMLNPATDAAKLMQGLAGGFANGSNPFDSSIFSDGASMAKDVQTFIQKSSSDMAQALQQIQQFEQQAASSVNQVISQLGIGASIQIGGLSLNASVTANGVSAGVGFRT